MTSILDDHGDNDAMKALAKPWQCIDVNV